MTNPRGPRRLCVWTLLAMLFATTVASATTSRREVNVVDLVANSELILRGTVVNLTDGIDDRGIPYTEVTLHVSEAIRGQVSGNYTFRQFDWGSRATWQWHDQPCGHPPVKRPNPREKRPSSSSTNMPHGPACKPPLAWDRANSRFPWPAPSTSRTTPVCSST